MFLKVSSSPSSLNLSLNAHKSTNGKNHYLGNVVYYEGENNGASFNEYILVDGQQRVE